MAELKPCPFCGGSVTMVYNSFDNAFKFYHKDCKKGEECRIIEPIMLKGISLAEAAEAWNRRADNG